MATPQMIARARAAKLLSYPVRAMSIWETLPDVKTTITQLVQGGNFSLSAMLADEMWADDRLSGVLSTRTDAVVCAPIKLTAADDSKKAQRALDMLGVSDDDPDGCWDEIFPDWLLTDLLVGMNVLNMGLAKQEWETVDGVQMPRVTPMHAQFVRWDTTQRCYYFRSESHGDVMLPRLDDDPHGDGNWLVSTPFGYENLRRGMIRWMGPLLIYRRWDIVDWANYNEVYGKPTRVAYVTGNDEAQQDAFVEEVNGAGANATVKVPRPDNAQDANANAGWGVDLIEAKSKGWDTFDGFKKTVEKDIAIGYLGVDLLTDSGGGGSLALSRMQEPRFLNRVTKDAKFLAKILRAQVLWHWAERNLGDGRLAPKVVIEVEPPESAADKATNYKATGGAGGAAPADDAEPDPNDPGEGTEPAEPAETPTPGKPKPKKVSAQARYIPVPPVHRYEFQSLPIAVENPKGSTRVWREEGADGAVIGQTHMFHDYGYIEGCMGADKEELDCYVGPHEDAADVHIVHQLRAPDYRADDEDKVMLGFRDGAEAKAAYLAHRNDGDKAYGGMSAIPLDRFKAKLKRRGDSSRKITAGGRTPGE